MPLVSLRVGLITSYNSAAYHDFLHELKESGFAFSVWMMDARMQGQRVELDVCAALRLLNEREGLDVIVIIRGGGARSEMAWFDSYKIAQAIAHFNYPVLTGLGHEIDLSVTDLVAHTYKKTPTAVAQYLVELVEGYLKELERVGGEVIQRGGELVLQARQQVVESGEQLVEVTKNRMQESREVLVESAWKVRESHHRLIRDTLLRLRSGSEQIKIRSRFNIRTAGEKVKLSWQRLSPLVSGRLQSQRHRLEMFQLRRNALDPIQVLKRGYTLTLDKQGKTIRRFSQVKIGDLMTTVLMEGQLKSQVVEKSPREQGQTSSTKDRKDVKSTQQRQDSERQMTLF